MKKWGTVRDEKNKAYYNERKQRRLMARNEVSKIKSTEFYNQIPLREM